jgi:hypothetical protein
MALLQLHGSGFCLLARLLLTLIGSLLGLTLIVGQTGMLPCSINMVLLVVLAIDASFLAVERARLVTVYIDDGVGCIVLVSDHFSCACLSNLAESLFS